MNQDHIHRKLFAINQYLAPDIAGEHRELLRAERDAAIASANADARILKAILTTSPMMSATTLTGYLERVGYDILHEITDFEGDHAHVINSVTLENFIAEDRRAILALCREYSDGRPRGRAVDAFLQAAIRGNDPALLEDILYMPESSDQDIRNAIARTSRLQHVSRDGGAVVATLLEYAGGDALAVPAIAQGDFRGLGILIANGWFNQALLDKMPRILEKLPSQHALLRARSRLGGAEGVLRMDPAEIKAIIMTPGRKTRKRLEARRRRAESREKMRARGLEIPESLLEENDPPCQ